MEKDLYNKIAKTTQTLSGRFSTLKSNYLGMSGFYRSYDIDVFKNRQEQLDVLVQIKDIPFRAYFKDKL